MDDLRGKVRTDGRLNAARAVSNDRLPPATPVDLAAGASFDSMRVSFTNTGDDGWCGEASAFEVRVSDAPISAENFSELPISMARRAGDVGQKEAPMFAVMPSSQGETKYVGVQMIDKVGNRSGIATREVQIRPARAAFEYSALQPADGWVVDSGWVQEDGAWRIQETNGSLESPVFDLTDHGDATVYLEASYDLEDHYEFVRVEVREEGTDRWRRLAELSGDSKGVKVHTLPMHEFDGKRVQLRLTHEGDGPGESSGFEFTRLVATGYRIGTQEP